jgi:hypothetical protein
MAQLRGDPAGCADEGHSASVSSYLPLRMIWGPAGSETDNWYYLPPSKANLAQLRVPIPPGYPRSG